MNTYFIFYLDTSEVIALYQATAPDVDRYLVKDREVGHAKAQHGAAPHDCVIESDPFETGFYLAFPKA